MVANGGLGGWLPVPAVEGFVAGFRRSKILAEICAPKSGFCVSPMKTRVIEFGEAVLRSIFPLSFSTEMKTRSPPGMRQRRGNLLCCASVGRKAAAIPRLIALSAVTWAAIEDPWLEAMSVRYLAPTMIAMARRVINPRLQMTAIKAKPSRLAPRFRDPAPLRQRRIRAIRLGRWTSRIPKIARLLEWELPPRIS